MIIGEDPELYDDEPTSPAIGSIVQLTTDEIIDPHCGVIGFCVPRTIEDETES